jgi:rhodanese-related sulfurtransferase
MLVVAEQKETIMNFDTIKTMFGGTSNGPSVQTISGPSAVQFVGDADTVFVDVRGVGEIQASGTAKGAIRAPLPEFARHAQADGSGSLPAAGAGKRIILMCASGARSGAAAQQLIKLGYENVANLRGGISAWIAAGGPLER